MTKNKQNELTDRNESLGKVIQEVRRACDIEGDSAADWKEIAEAIALKHVPELQPKKRLGRPPMKSNIKLIRHSIKLAVVGHYRHKYNLSVEAAVKKSGIKWGTFRKLRAEEPSLWAIFRDNPSEVDNFHELLGEMITELVDKLYEFEGGWGK